MKIVFWLITVMCCISMAHASANWKLTEVTGQNKIATGYVYHTESVGSRIGKSGKVYSGLRLICAKQGVTVLALYWNEAVSLRNDTLVFTTITNKFTEPTLWHADENLLYLGIHEAANILQMLKTGKIIRFQWTDMHDNLYTTAFEVSGFDITSFDAKCNT